MWIIRKDSQIGNFKRTLIGIKISEHGDINAGNLQRVALATTYRSGSEKA